MRTGTTAAVWAFQRRHGLTVDGVVGKTTWDAIYREYRSIQSDNGTPNAYPGTPGVRVTGARTCVWSIVAQDRPLGLLCAE